MMIENCANKCDKLKRELEKNEDIELPTALKLLHTESKKPVTVGVEHTMVQIGIQNLARITISM